MECPPEQQIWLVHTPPKDTNLDYVGKCGGLHVGSQAVRNAILLHGPALTLHGHIHKTVEDSGGGERFREKLSGMRTTWIMTAGEQYEKSKLRCLLVLPDGIQSKSWRLVLSSSDIAVKVKELVDFLC